MQQHDVIIIGAGGAGMMCAIEAAKRGRRVLLIDHAKTLGAKILISGGGRCNFTNTGAVAERYVSDNVHFARSALSRFTPADFLARVQTHGIAYYEKKLGQLFCTISARAIVDLLITECRDAGAVFSLDTRITSIAKQHDGFHVHTSRGSFRAESLVIATGGLSIPKIGATGFGYDIARQFGLLMVPTAPALDGFVLPEAVLQSLDGLTGVALDTIVTCNGVAFRENILFTHKGLSGPAALQASLYWRPGDSLHINFLPDVDFTAWLADKHTRGARAEIKNLLLEFFPKSFADRCCALAMGASMPLPQCRKEHLRALTQQLTAWTITPLSTVGYSKAEVTRGGVDTAELSSKTMEAKKVPGLYFIGEVVDVTGWLGGYNFQWAWSSGWVAGQYV